jgi:hypothetical protein
MTTNGMTTNGSWVDPEERARIAGTARMRIFGLIGKMP